MGTDPIFSQSRMRKMGSVPIFSYVPHQTGRVASGDVSIFFRQLGNRALTPILIVHGLSYFSWDWLEVGQVLAAEREVVAMDIDRKSTRLNSSHSQISYAVFCLKKKNSSTTRVPK